MSTCLPIVERFHSLQGEGLHFGKSAFFIRLGGCKVGCPWCDTKESWSIATHQEATVEELSKEAAIAQSQGAAILVITGGEPLHHNLNALCKTIQDFTSHNSRETMPIHLETSGVDEITGLINWITLSPKRHALPKKSLLRACDEIKVVIHQKEDLLFAEEMANQSIKERQISKKTSDENHKISQPHLFLQPGWNSKEGTQLTIEYIKSHPQWRLSLQTHKWLGVL
ncbi:MULTISPECIES: 7-carboxy-7-deazaguanine synthase QueE [Prochlorococcus]|uniref:7-carboxy-7-deazaguanine synthase n=1 Tax=Prochlorococcus marinus (strain SARG / CCMP1375 / SS120) TaxID=167539 RepID=QUEE_PROMA|nr:MULTISPECIES: 7-carboxy-7-deazaguanine synthase QueE [Prochlorococcus]Q7V9H9.1 RecName: Full=7-carboxy-7-deazaguanine synthase; Short=CDG synthase; AltName: Full=Queuosine biosynthesis protein QueE [Prochlorococcus marinus subsp. marinus str. CCMP1375]AAQ00898.1 Radical activating enzyme [Prochlorococcus marinus subsp. marinus str. CCMP1375]KGG10607.1 Queuosine Biosynthesis QueE Radical SAM [Prochlorococcus marinus str. LG]KGG19927.1 Queuosine Biosynthesis QueE Radical SAM [Prochlorococcus m